MSIENKNAAANLDERTTDASNKIDAIKQLIFGENMQAYDEEFQLLKQDLHNKKKELQDLIEDIKTELLQNIDNLSTDVNIRITELESSLEDKVNTLESKKIDKALLGDMLIKLGENISK